MYSVAALSGRFRKMSGGIIKPKLKANLRSLTPINENIISSSKVRKTILGNKSSITTAKKNSLRFKEASARIEHRRRHGFNAAKRVMKNGAEPTFGYKLKVSILNILHLHTSTRNSYLHKNVLTFKYCKLISFGFRFISGM